jgi:predicted Zn finger-like uncharacterized protein
MSDILFDCPHCEKSLKVDSSAVGMQVECPECGHEIEIPSGQPDEEQNVEAYQEDAPEEPEQAPEPQAPKPAPQAEHQSMTPAQFRELLEQTSRNIVPQLEAASAEIRRALE